MDTGHFNELPVGFRARKQSHKNLLYQYIVRYDLAISLYTARTNEISFNMFVPFR